MAWLCYAVAGLTEWCTGLSFSLCRRQGNTQDPDCYFEEGAEELYFVFNAVDVAEELSAVRIQVSASHACARPSLEL